MEVSVLKLTHCFTFLAKLIIRINLRLIDYNINIVKRIQLKVSVDYVSLCMTLEIRKLATFTKKIKHIKIITNIL